VGKKVKLGGGRHTPLVRDQRRARGGEKFKERKLIPKSDLQARSDGHYGPGS